jgi:hypothetical protein
LHFVISETISRSNARFGLGPNLALLLSLFCNLTRGGFPQEMLWWENVCHGSPLLEKKLAEVESKKARFQG